MLGYPLWDPGDELITAYDVECAHGRMVMECDRLTGNYADSRHVMNRWDNLPREQARAEFLAEVLLEQERRAAV